MKPLTCLELLSPAKDVETGIAAIRCGADAVYIGGPKFSARHQAANEISAIEHLCKYAHRFNVRVYAAVNTIIYDYELTHFESLLNDLYHAGIDGYIVQDLAVLEMQIPPLPLIASTQCHNSSIQRLKMLETAGFSRAILARELSLDQISEIRRSTTIGLEAFVHGSLCVCYSGRCYLSLINGGRSANRGECAQPCRLEYTLTDNNGTIISSDKHLLCLKDMNRLNYIAQLSESGVTSFKIEGRLKDTGYVKNITGCYSEALNRFIEHTPGFTRSSSGTSRYNFIPDVTKTFNRGYTVYFLTGRNEKVTSMNTPKSTGQFIGKVKSVHPSFFEIETNHTIVNNDGICFFTHDGHLDGFNVNSVDGKNIFPSRMPDLKPGTRLYRNYDHSFTRLLETDGCSRTIDVKLTFNESDEGFILHAEDKDNNKVKYILKTDKQKPRQPEQAKQAIITQLSRSGGTIFNVTQVENNCSQPWFIPLSVLNGMRRQVLLLLEAERIKNYQRPVIERNTTTDALLWQAETDHANIANRKAGSFFEGLRIPGDINSPELTGFNAGMTVMKTKMCLRYEFNICPIYQKNEKGEKAFSIPFHLSHDKQQYIVEFDCSECVMLIKTGK